MSNEVESSAMATDGRSPSTRPPREVLIVSVLWIVVIVLDLLLDAYAYATIPAKREVVAIVYGVEGFNVGLLINGAVLVAVIAPALIAMRRRRRWGRVVLTVFAALLALTRGPSVAWMILPQEIVTLAIIVTEVAVLAAAVVFMYRPAANAARRQPRLA